MSRTLMSVTIIIAVLTSAGVRGSRCAEETKPWTANVWSPFHTRMSQHDHRNPADLRQTTAACVYWCVCVCVEGSGVWGLCINKKDLEIMKCSTISSLLHDFPIPVFRLCRLDLQITPQNCLKTHARPPNLIQVTSWMCLETRQIRCVWNAGVTLPESECVRAYERVVNSCRLACDTRLCLH